MNLKLTVRRFFKAPSKRSLLRGAMVAVLVLAGKTIFDFQKVPRTPREVSGAVTRQLIVDRQGRRLTSTLANRWNEFDQVPLSSLPEFLVKAFITAEDRKFYQHAGVDWLGRLSALYQGSQRAYLFRGASTITEQVVRMLHPRPRNLWSRWLETWEAYALERQWDKASILEFYLNQVPFGGHRRGVLEASEFYFSRSLSTLNQSEMLALAVLVRAPSFLDPKKQPQRLLQRIQWLASAMGIDPQSEEFHQIALATEEISPLSLGRVENIFSQSQVAIDAPHFSEWARRSYQLGAFRRQGTSEIIETTLNGSLQNIAQKLLDQQIVSLREKNVNQGALLVADHQTGEVLAWAVSKTTNYNAVLVPRQPGSTMKPFLYALTFERGWTPATMIVDEPLITAVGQGAHAIRNYSRQYYGPVTVREALGNSLNTPAIKAIKFIDPKNLLELLKRAKITSLTQEASFYGEGLALGSAEVSLLELVQAYTLFANEGRVRTLSWFKGEPGPVTPPLVDAQAASLVAHILADPKARALEFGRQSILNFPSATSIKTGTATDYRDAWAIGLNGRYIVGVWMGDLNREPSAGNTGARGPALLLRSIFHQIGLIYSDSKPLGLHPDLIAQDLCRAEGGAVMRAHDGCSPFTEYFIAGTESQVGEGIDEDSGKKATVQAIHSAEPPNEERRPEISGQTVRVSFPFPHLQMAWDPRLPAEAQAVALRVDNTEPGDRIRWWINKKYLGETEEKKILWTLARGPKTLEVEVRRRDGSSYKVKPVSFLVK